MVNWEDIHSGFDSFYQKCWEKAGLTYPEAQEWIRIGFEPKDYQEVNQWKRHNFIPQEAKAWREIGLKDTELATYLRNKDHQPNIPDIKEIITKESWQDIHPDFNCSIRKNWEQEKFNKEQTKKWINVGTKSYDYKFVAWLRDIKKETPDWITDYQDDYQILSNRFKEYGLCLECKQLNTGKSWCQPCSTQRFRQNFYKWYKWNITLPIINDSFCFFVLLYLSPLFLL